MKVLITGAAGAVGSTLVRGMKDRYELRGFDRQPMPEMADAIVGDVADPEAVKRATEGVEVVIHLAGAPGGGYPWEAVLPSNFVGCYNVFEACRLNGVRRVVYASRAGILGWVKDTMRTVDQVPRPDSYYSASKIFGEGMGWMYQLRYGIEFLGVRIGNFSRTRDLPEHPHQLSHGDAVRVFERAAIQPGVKYEIVFGVSDSTWPMYDIDHGRRVIGYYPQDKSVWEPTKE
ncbi:MAG: NAD(P)-dependent oxidoreductase [SAR202 cluster bacterium]|nr:NAD(P)-dependent oxidoreductase [SAR202 cluster bacterium]